MAAAPEAALTSAGTVTFPAPEEMSFEKAHLCPLFDSLQSIRTKAIFKSPLSHPARVRALRSSGGAKLNLVGLGIVPWELRFAPLPANNLTLSKQ